MPYWEHVSAEERELIGPIMGFTGSRLKRVELIEDIEATSRQQVHILEGYVGKRREVRGIIIVRPGEIDRLTELVASISQADPASDYFAELLSEAEDVFKQARDKWKKSMRTALQRRDIPASEKHLAHRIDTIFEIIGWILVRQREAKRIIDKIRTGFDRAYIRMYYAIRELEQDDAGEGLSLGARTLLGTRIHEKVFRYLTRYVAAFEPFYSIGHDPSVMTLEDIQGLLVAGKTRTAINKLDAAMNAIEKVVSGTVPTAATIRNLRARTERRRP
jgi:hypothetical protein